MKRILCIITAIAMAGTVVFAQDMKKATELAQNANAELSEGNFEAALEGFRAALAEAEACEEGAELVATCQGVIPGILYSMGNGCIETNDYTEAIAKFTEALAEAEKYGNAEIAEKAGKQIAVTYMKIGGDALNAKQFAEAEAAYLKATESDPTNGMAYLRLGLAQQQSGKLAEAEASFKLAAENGQAEEAGKRMQSLSLLKVSIAYKNKKYAEAIALGDEHNKTYGNDAKAYQFIIFSCLSSKKLTEAANYYNQYSEAFPDAGNKGEFAFRIAVKYHEAGNTAKAKEFYQQAVNDPKYGKTAKETLATLK